MVTCMIQCLLCFYVCHVLFMFNYCNDIHFDDVFCVAQTEAMIPPSDQIGAIPTVRGWVFLFVDA